jgi:hypothetical protein
MVGTRVGTTVGIAVEVDRGGTVVAVRSGVLVVVAVGSGVLVVVAVGSATASSSSGRQTVVSNAATARGSARTPGTFLRLLCSGLVIFSGSAPRRRCTRQ